MSRLLKKLIAVLLVITLAGANLSILGMHGIAYALSDEELAEQTTTTENKNVEFNAYFEGGGHVRTEGIISSNAKKLFLNIKVKDAGYLKNGVISFENTNFKIGDVNNNDVQSVDKQNNKILLKQLNNGSDVTIEVPISFLNGEHVSTDYFSKETKTKFSGTYVDSNGKEKSVSKEIINKLSWNGTAEGLVEVELTKYVPYATGEKYGVMLQTKVNSGVVSSALPIKKTEINVGVPELNGTYPTDVNVIAINTKATNGKEDGTDFTSDNYTYDAETGIVKITVENAANEIVWLKDVKDEYLVTFIFEGQETYNNVTTNGINTKLSTGAVLELYNNEETIAQVAAISTVVQATEKIGTVADFDIEMTDKISKGQVYSNYDSEVKEETEYFVRYISTINSADLTDNIVFNQSVDKFLTAEDAEGLTTIADKNYVYNKTIKVSETVFKKILGEEGSISLYKADQTEVGVINKNTEIKNGNYVLDISSSDSNELQIVASKPITEGQLIIDIEKAIKTEIDYSKTQFKDFNRIEAKLEGKASSSTVNANTQMLLKEPTSVADIATSKTDLTTVVKNENVEIRAILDTSNLYNALYKNPTLKIKLPSHISEVDLKQTDIVMANGLKIKGTPKVTTENGAPVISMELEGTQKEYTIDAEYKGTIVVLNTDLTVKTLTPTNSNKITMEFTNANDVSVNSEGTVEAELNFVAPTGIVAANGISNYADGKDDILSISDENITGGISAYAEKRVATVYGKIVNNYENAIGDIVIFGRLPVKDNKKIDSTDNLGSTFSTTLKTNIVVKGIEEAKYAVYYSENVDASKDLTVAANGWSTTATTGAKSYMIVTNEYEMAAGEIIEFSYDVEIPENLKYNNNVYEMYKVYYNNLSTIGKMAESKTSSIVGMTTGQGPELTVELNSNVDVIKEGQIVKMKVTVENTGSIVANNVKVNIPLPSKTAFVEYYPGTGFYEEEGTTKVIDIGTIEIGKKKQVSYYIKLDNDMVEYPGVKDPNNITKEEIEAIENAEKFPKEIVNQVTISVDDFSGEIPSNRCVFSVGDGLIALDIYSATDESHVVKDGDIVTFLINLQNISSDGNLVNSVVTIPLPDCVKYVNAVIRESWEDETEISEGISYDEEKNIVQINVGTIDFTKVIILDVEVQEYEGAFTIFAKAQAEGTEEHYSNILEYMSEIIDLEVSELTSTPKYVKEGEEVTYTLKLTNKGESTVYSINVTDILPEGLTFVEATYMYAGQEQVVTRMYDGKVQIAINQLGAGESTTIKLIAKADLLPNKNDKEVKNNMIVNAKGFEQHTTNTVTNIIEYYAQAHEQESTEPGETPEKPSKPTENRYKITGTAWLDENKNGKRDTEEQVLSDISVMLLNKDDNSIVIDTDTNNQKKTTTDSQGKYEFSNLPKGEYIVIFLYDASRYNLTTYQEKDVDEGLNSDAININITLDGNRTIAGTTDVIKITNDNVRDIDIGLYSSEKFDLKLDKYISKITLTTPTSGTKTYTNSDSKLEKVEILGQNLGKSNIVIEYKIVVTNEGAIPGYAKKIVDYLPEELGFNTELNKDWYLSDNGNLYNASLANELIEPGKSKEVTLIVTKKITEDSLGTPINNNAEIYESYNEQGLKDMDSEAGNKVQEEDDMSRADIILSLVTGKIIMYTTIALGVISILGFGIWEIKKRVLNKGNK